MGELKLAGNPPLKEEGAMDHEMQRDAWVRKQLAGNPYAGLDKRYCAERLGFQPLDSTPSPPTKGFTSDADFLRSLGIAPTEHPERQVDG